MKDFINFNLLSLYIKYSLISLPQFNSIYKNEKINSWISKKYKTNLKTNHKILFNYLEKQIDIFVKSQIKAKGQICLMVSSGRDSRLLYNLIEKYALKYDYIDNFYTFTSVFQNYKKYNEYLELKKIWKKSPRNHTLIKIKANEAFKLLKLANKINRQPVNGLPNILYLKAVEHICNKFKDENKTIVVGIGDQIFFNGNYNTLKVFNKDALSIKLHDNNFKKNFDCLSYKYETLVEKIYSNLKIKNFLKIKNNLLNYININSFNTRGPKVINEFSNIFNWYKVDFFAPFINKKFIDLTLSLPKKDIYDGGMSKTFINFAMSQLNIPNYKNYGLKITTPQREIIFNNQKIINNLIKNSKLIDLGIIDKEKLIKAYKEYIMKYKASYKKKTSFSKLDSYDIWKFISSEYFIQNCLKD